MMNATWRKLSSGMIATMANVAARMTPAALIARAVAGIATAMASRSGRRLASSQIGATAAPTAEAGAGAGPPGGDAPRPAGPARGMRSWWPVAPAFVLGLFAGAVILGLIREDPPPVPGTAAEAPAGSGESPSGGAAPTPGARAEFTVNDDCLRVVNATQDLVEALGDLGSAAADLDISGLDQAIRRLQPLETRLREDLEGCETDATLPGDLSPVPTPSDFSPPDPAGHGPVGFTRRTHTGLRKGPLPPRGGRQSRASSAVRSSRPSEPCDSAAMCQALRSKAAPRACCAASRPSRQARSPSL